MIGASAAAGAASPAKHGPASLTPSGAVSSSSNGQVIEGLDITVTGTTDGITITHTDVIVRFCRIHYDTGAGIDASTAHRLLIHDVDIYCDGAPAAGENASDAMNCITISGSDDVRLNRVRGRDGSGIVYILNCQRPVVTLLEGYNARGPNPRGNLIQFNQSDNFLLEDFKIRNTGNVATPQDVVSSYECINGTIRRGFIYGSTGESAQCVIFEVTGTEDGGLCEDVDAVYWGNGAFMASGQTAATGGGSIVFRRCRARDGLDVTPNDSEGELDFEGNTIPDWATFVGALARTQPQSGGEAFFAFECDADIEFHDCEYFNLPHSGATHYDPALMTVIELSDTNFTVRPQVALSFGWE